MTRRVFELATGGADLEKVAAKSHKGEYESYPIRAWTEGNYGHQIYLGEEHETMMLVAGGSGVSYSLSVMLDIVRKARATELEIAELSVATERLTFVLMLKHIGMFALLVCSQEISLASPQIN